MNGISIAHRIDDAWNDPIYQIHDYYEINLPVANGADGSGFFFEDKMYKIKRGALFLINNTNLHFNTSLDAPYERYLICFYPEILRPFHTPDTDLLACFHKAGENVLQLGEGQLEELLAIIRKMETAETRQYGADIERVLLLIEILLYVNRLSALDSKTVAAKVSKESLLVSPILQYINAHLGEPLSLQRIASAFFIGRGRLCASFKQATGYTVNEYILYRRILQAKQLLSQNLSVQEISDTVGFNNYTHFIRSFKKITGKPPKQYMRDKA